MSKFIDAFVKRCPKTGRIRGFRKDKLYVKILFPLIGIVALLWFLIRVVPKPSRIAYPCQQAAASISVGFITWIASVIATAPIFYFLRKKINKKLAYTFIFIFVLLASTSSYIYLQTQVFTPVFTNEGPNKPIGVGRGIFQGRVSWVQDFKATLWDEKSGNWWDETNIDQKEADKMLSQGIQNISGAKTDVEAWNKIFIYNNQQRGRGNLGYTKGEKIVIKINMNAIHNKADDWKNQGYPSPHMLFAMVKQLIENAGVNGNDIIITDPSRHIGSQLYNKIRSGKSPEFQKVLFCENTARNLPGYINALPDTTNNVYFNMPDGKKYKMAFPKVYTEATYILNFALVRPHRVFGITSAAKNHFGSVWCYDSVAFKPNPLHAFALWDYSTPNKMGQVHSAPVLLGHKCTNEKTFLYFADGLYTSITQTGTVRRWSTMENQWFSSILMSLDPVALESVQLDFVSSEPNLTAGNKSFNGNQDNQLHESALANNPPSGTKYDPENDGIPITKSLGTHEHWNNAVDKKYSRNLGKKEGIELVHIPL